MIFQLAAILQLRCKQLFRILYQLGILRIVFVLTAITVPVVAIQALISTGKNTCLTASVYLLFILIIHIKRRDKSFLKINISQFRSVFWLEYMVLSMPLIICLLLYAKWLILLCVVVGTLLISLIDFDLIIRRKTLNTRIQKLIPSDMYEWKAGVRRNFTGLLIVYVSGICLSYFAASIPVAMIIIGLLISEFFIPDESWQILLSFEKSPEKLLLYKIKRHFLLYGFCNLPLIILFVLFHSDWWYIPFIEFAILLSIHIYIITVKFAFYKTDGINNVNAIWPIIGIVFGLIPVTTPFLLLLSGFFFQKACTNLKSLLHDYD